MYRTPKRLWASPSGCFDEVGKYDWRLWCLKIGRRLINMAIAWRCISDVGFFDSSTTCRGARNLSERKFILQPSDNYWIIGWISCTNRKMHKENVKRYLTKSHLSWLLVVNRASTEYVKFNWSLIKHLQGCIKIGPAD